MKNETPFDPAHRPWLATYASAGIVAELPTLRHASLAELVQERCAHFAAEQAAKRLKHPAFSCVMPNGMNGRLSFAQVNDLSDAFAGYLRQTLGLKSGDRVAVQMPNCLAYPVVAFGVFKAGCVLVNTNPLYTPSEMAHQFKDSGAKVLVIVDRKEAIKTACAISRANDIILVAGKGHETYQEINGVKHHFDDKEVLREVFESI